MLIGIASDHGGYELKSQIIKKFNTLHLLDLGTNSNDRTDYPLIADHMCNRIQSKELDNGILICGTGIGISIRANRFNGIRAALVYSEYTAKMAKAHNNANIICLGGRTTSLENALTIIQLWLDTPFEYGRHLNRIEQLDRKTN